MIPATGTGDDNDDNIDGDGSMDNGTDDGITNGGTENNDSDKNDSDKNNSDSDKNDTDVSAKTGDESNTALWISLLLISLIVGSAAVIRRKEC